MKLIIGLGNPGQEYAHTRHNLGWDAVAALAEALEATWTKKSDFKAEVAEARLGNEKILLAHPLTFMNLSGESVQKMVAFYKIDLHDVLVVHDERDFALGEFAFSARGGDAGHNGVASIQSRLATDEIARLRLGIGRPPAPIKMEDFVLQHFSDDEQAVVDLTLDKAAAAQKSWLSDGLEKAMNVWNRRV